MSDETVRLTCEIQYGTKVNQKTPTLFWFEDIYDVKYRSNSVLNLTKSLFFPLA